MSLKDRTRASDGQYALENKHVFVINGAVEVLELVRELLQDERYNVTTTNFTPRTWHQIDALQPDLIMVDLVVGQLAGWELLEDLHLKFTTCGIPVIIFSTDQSLLYSAECLAYRFGGQRYLAKPFDIDVLCQAVRDLIGPAEREREVATVVDYSGHESGTAD